MISFWLTQGLFSKNVRNSVKSPERFNFDMVEKKRLVINMEELDDHKWESVSVKEAKGSLNLRKICGKNPHKPDQIKLKLKNLQPVDL